MKDFKILDLFSFRKIKDFREFDIKGFESQFLQE